MHQGSPAVKVERLLEMSLMTSDHVALVLMLSRSGRTWTPSSSCSRKAFLAQSVWTKSGPD
eukprot:14181305-Heterocapsa_arctica.AAC.1